MATVPNQRLLLAIGSGRTACILAAEGETAQSECKQVSWHPDDHFDTGTLPQEPGLYVWEGAIEIIPEYGEFGSGPYGADVTWKGSFHRVQVKALEAFGLPV